VIVAPEHPPRAQRQATAGRQSAEAIRDVAATVALVALSYDGIAAAADAAAGSDPAGPHCDRAAWARTRAEEERRLALRMWARAAALDSAAH
jgi:hypothetical protein